jgi:mRNA degradation ribonuclease J1/J2
VLSHITSTVKNLATNETQVFADLNGHKVNGTIIPADILATSGAGSRPDLVLIDRNKKEISLIKLTCSLPNLTHAATKRKTTHYTQLEIALIEKGYTVYLVPFEVCSNGHITKKNNTNIDNVLKKFRIRLTRKTYLNLSKIALLCTMSVFHAFQVTDWVNPPLLSP